MQHPIVKKFVRLRTSKKARYREKRIPLIGIKLVEEAQDVDLLLTTAGYRHSVCARQWYRVTGDILKKVSGQVNPEPVAALVPMPPFADLSGKRRIVALDRVRDPGNVGTLIRTACGLGFEGMFLTTDSADPFQDKVLRSAMGAVLRLPLQVGDVGDLLELASGFHPLVADTGGIPFRQVRPVRRPLLILGSEAHGVAPELKRAFPAISIPIGQIESFNVSAAGAILMYYLVHEG